jgi:D-amino-acid dehydrogenase
MNIGIIGGGIIGLSSAYYLVKAGHTVTVIDQGDLQIGCSTGNAGMIVPSHLVPLAAPGMISKGIRWMFNPTSPFYVKPRWSGDLIKWGYYFYRSATQQHVERSAPALKEISLLSKAMYQQMAKELPFDFGYKEKGLLMLYQSKETEHEEAETVKLANRYSIEAHLLSLTEIKQLEPEAAISARGGVYFPGDAHLIPQELIPKLISFLLERGVVFKTKTNVKDFTVEKQTIRAVQIHDGNLEFDEVVIATGSWSGLMSSKLGLSLPMQAGKGYSFLLDNAVAKIRIPSILLEARVAVTPMGNSIRFGGTMEISGIDHSINMNRVKGIVDSVPNYYPEMNIAIPAKDAIWHGLRPCSPDGLPYIGRTENIKNVIIATGHSMMGLSLGPGTGKLVSEIIAKTKPSVDLTMFKVNRF